MPFYLIAENMNVAIFIKTVHFKKKMALNWVIPIGVNGPYL